MRIYITQYGRGLKYFYRPESTDYILQIAINVTIKGEPYFLENGNRRDRLPLI